MKAFSFRSLVGKRSGPDALHGLRELSNFSTPDTSMTILPILG